MDIHGKKLTQVVAKQQPPAETKPAPKEAPKEDKKADTTAAKQAPPAKGVEPEETKTEEWRERRDELIREAASNGGTLREIAAAVGMSNPGVLRVIRRGGELEAMHIRPMREGGGKNDPDNIEFLTPEGHARRDRGEPES